MMSAATSTTDRRVARERRLTFLFRIVLALVVCPGAVGMPPRLAGIVQHSRPGADRAGRWPAPARGRSYPGTAAAPGHRPGQRQGSRRAVELARGMGHAWRHSGLFADVQVDVDVDLDAVRKQLLSQPLALAAARPRHADPAIRVLRRAAGARAGRSVSFTGLVPANDDLLGLSHAAERALRTPGAVQLDLVSGTLIAHDGGKDWVLVRAQTRGDAFDGASPAQVARVVDDAGRRSSRTAARCWWRAACGAGGGRARAVGESGWISAMAVLGIIAVLLLTMRGWRSLRPVAAVAMGLLCGAVACVALFGTIHVLTAGGRRQPDRHRHRFFL